MAKFKYEPNGNFEVFIKRKGSKPILIHRLGTSLEAENYAKYGKEKFPNLTFIIVNKIDEQKAKEFFRDLLGTIHSHGNSGIMSEYLVADHMGISPERARDMLWACKEFGITERQGGGFVV